MPAHDRSLPARAGWLLAAVAVLSALVLTAARDVGASGDRFPVQLVRVDVPTWEDRDRLTNLGLDLTEHAGHDYVEVVLHTAADAAVLEDNGFTWEVEIPDLALRQAQNNRADAAYAAATEESPLPSGRDTYRTLADYDEELAALAHEHSGLVQEIKMGEKGGLGLPNKTLEGRTVRGVEISEDVAATGDGKPTFLLMGLHHAREWPSGEHAMEFAFDLAQNFGKDPRITNLLRRARVVVVPVVNPDGFEQSRKWGDIVDLRAVDEGGIASILATPGNAYKRKNCRVIDGVDQGTPGACEVASPGGFGLGVDLNRNYGGSWGGAGASPLGAHATYRGAGPFSEPETQNIRDLVSARHVTTLISNHTFSNLVLRPPGVRNAGTTVDEPAMKDLGARMAAQNGYRNIHGWQLYDTTGTTEDWSYAATGGYGYTFEIGPDEFHPPFPEVVDEYLGKGPYKGRGNREAFLLALEAAADPAHHSVIAGGAPSGAVLTLTKDFQTKTSSARTISDRIESTLVPGPNGRFEWHVNPSTRPEVMEHRVRVLAQEPSREETTRESNVVWAPGDHIDIPFAMPESGVGALKVDLDWPTPDDLDLYVYHVNPDGSLVEVGSSGNFVADKEEALVELPEPGSYVLRVVNYASVTTEFTVTAGLYAVAREDVTGSNDIVETYTLTCSRDGVIRQTVEVAVDRGESQRVDLSACGDGGPATAGTRGRRV